MADRDDWLGHRPMLKRVSRAERERQLNAEAAREIEREGQDQGLGWAIERMAGGFGRGL